MRTNFIKRIALTALLFASTLIVINLVAASGKKPVEVIFSHQFHVADQEFDCSSCHPEIESSSFALDDNLPTMDECGSCHDTEDDENCGLCHLDPDDFLAVTRIEREILFNHQLHIENGSECNLCHNGVDNNETMNRHFLPEMSVCMDCHDGQKADNSCDKCHSGKITLADIHPLDWRHQHGDYASTNRAYCLSCHSQQQFCLDCHFGDNLSGNIHELNFQYSHALEAQSKKADCVKCHSRQEFCVSCHQSGNRMPLAHSTTSWIIRHGQAAKNDVENCASCHNTNDPTCAQSACHYDDGILGNNPRIHTEMFDTGKGPWHNNDDYYCYDCHKNTYIAGVDFCGYCHSGLK